MLSKKHQLHYINRGLGLKETFLLYYLRKMPQPINLNKILNENPLLEIKERQLKQLLQNLEDSNLLCKQKVLEGLYLRFTKINKSAIKHTIINNKKCKKAPNTTLKFYKLQHFALHRNINIYNKHKTKCINNTKRKQEVEDINVVKEKTQGYKIKLNRNIQQIKVVFAKNFPNKNNYVSTPLPPNFDINLLIENINQSQFLTSREYLGLNWCITHYDAIISGFYKTYDIKSTPQEPFQQEHTPPPQKKKAPDNMVVNWQGKTYTPDEFEKMLETGIEKE